MRTWTIAISLLVHVAIFGVVMWSGRTPPVHKGTEVTVLSKPKPKPADPKPDEDKPKPPPPPPRVAPKVAAPAPTAPPPPAAVPAPAPTSAPRVASGLTLSNGPATGGPGGVAIGGLSNGTLAANGPPPPGDDRPPRQPPPPREEDACDQADTKPRPVGTVQVDYPDKARADGLEGRIQVRIHVGNDGSVIGVDVVEGIDPSLDAVVLAVLRTWKFQPATHCGRPTPGVLAWAQRFELGD
jgi:protein TonB